MLAIGQLRGWELCSLHLHLEGSIPVSLCKHVGACFYISQGFGQFLPAHWSASANLLVNLVGWFQAGSGLTCVSMLVSCVDCLLPAQQSISASALVNLIDRLKMGSGLTYVIVHSSQLVLWLCNIG